VESVDETVLAVESRAVEAAVEVSDPGKEKQFGLARREIMEPNTFDKSFLFTFFCFKNIYHFTNLHFFKENHTKMVFG